MSDTETPGNRWTMKKFLETAPLSAELDVTINAGKPPSSAPNRENLLNVRLPSLQLYCDKPTCGDEMTFDPSVAHQIQMNVVAPITDGDSRSARGDYFVWYYCRHCRITRKTYALNVVIPDADEPTAAQLTKIGEDPPAAPLTPRELLNLLADERQQYLKGRRCENMGLGVGAFSYYRRVVENHKERLITRAREVAEREGAGADVLDRLQQAATAREFKRAVELTQDVMPRSLLVANHNPMTLLHSALSAGMHEGSDGDCMEAARTIRLVLTAFAERITAALRDEAELRTAIGLLTRPSTRPQ